MGLSSREREREILDGGRVRVSSSEQGLICPTHTKRFNSVLTVITAISFEFRVQAKWYC